MNPADARERPFHVKRHPLTAPAAASWGRKAMSMVALRDLGIRTEESDYVRPMSTPRKWGREWLSIAGDTRVQPWIPVATLRTVVLCRNGRTSGDRPCDVRCCPASEVCAGCARPRATHGWIPSPFHVKLTALLRYRGASYGRFSPAGCELRVSRDALMGRARPVRSHMHGPRPAPACASSSTRVPDIDRTLCGA